MYAHLFKTASGFDLHITTSPSLCDGAGVVVRVATKREARAIAKRSNAQPWNF